MSAPALTDLTERRARQLTDLAADIDQLSSRAQDLYVDLCEDDGREPALWDVCKALTAALQAISRAEGLEAKR